MSTAIVNPPDDVQGDEHDWLACDEKGCVALFTTAAGGFAPEAFLRDTEAHQLAIAAILGLEATTTARFAPHLGSGSLNVWKQVAERGLFAYDSDYSGGPYRLVAAPMVVTRVTSLPRNIAALVSEIRLPLHFEAHDVLTEKMVVSAALPL